jgi:hypothetical protein
MEDVLDLDEEPDDPQYPTVCFDEKPVVLRAEARPAQPVAPGRLVATGRPQRRDYA